MRNVAKSWLTAINNLQNVIFAWLHSNFEWWFFVVKGHYFNHKNMYFSTYYNYWSSQRSSVLMCSTCPVTRSLLLMQMSRHSLVASNRNRIDLISQGLNKSGARTSLITIDRRSLSCCWVGASVNHRLNSLSTPTYICTCYKVENNNNNNISELWAVYKYTST